MTDADSMDVITLHPGDVVLGLRGQRLQTLLGSCVSVILTDPRRSLGVMCHIVHAGPGSRSVVPSGAYADDALASMVSMLQAHGILASKCEAFVFGGGNMFPSVVSGVNVGDHNVRRALLGLEVMGVRALLVDTGGAVYRKLSWTVGHDAPLAVAVAL